MMNVQPCGGSHMKGIPGKAAAAGVESGNSTCLHFM